MSTPENFFTDNEDFEMKRFASLVALMLAFSTVAIAQDGTAEDRPFGPPAEVVAAWEAGFGDLLPGPPAWVVEMKASGNERPVGMPPWVAEMHQRAFEIGLPGPPPEVIEAWENGEGDSLPGPPPFVLEILGMFGSSS
ncbi:MAG: hypothetical protein AAFP90_00615 [Planctomycetota bacterium]